MSRAYQVIDGGIRDYFAKHGHVLPEHYAEEIHLLDQYRQEGYGKYDARIEACIQKQYCMNSLPLDPIYTGKAFWGMQEYIEAAGIRDSRILFLHTGGTPLFFDYVTAKAAIPQQPQDRIDAFGSTAETEEV